MKRPSFQFYPGDWLRDAALRSCSRPARSLWLDLMCIMHQAEPYGHLALNGRGMTDEEASRATGDRLTNYRRWLAEIERAGVSSRTADGVLFSRRMVKDAELRALRQEIGKMGGNPKLMPDDKGPVNQSAKLVIQTVEDEEEEIRDRGVGKGKQTWLTPYWDAWKERYGGAPAEGPLARAAKLVERDVGAAEAVARFRRYVTETPAQYASPMSWSQKHGGYAAPTELEMTDECGMTRLHRKRPDGGWEAKQDDGTWQAVEYAPAA